ncbi:MAG TPA: hypothetical protein PKY25_02240 [Bacilli bacterium]|nr:hypothetical protein [Bacilli bacterium]
MKDSKTPDALESLINANKLKKKRIFEDPKFKNNKYQTKNVTSFKNIRTQNRGK